MSSWMINCRLVLHVILPEEIKQWKADNEVHIAKIAILERKGDQLQKQKLFRGLFFFFCSNKKYLLHYDMDKMYEL